MGAQVGQPEVERAGGAPPGSAETINVGAGVAHIARPFGGK